MEVHSFGVIWVLDDSMFFFFQTPITEKWFDHSVEKVLDSEELDWDPLGFKTADESPDTFQDRCGIKPNKMLADRYRRPFWHKGAKTCTQQLKVGVTFDEEHKSTSVTMGEKETEFMISSPKYIQQTP